MSIENTIRKRINTTQMLKGKKINEVQITKEEARQLENRKRIDGVKLVVVDKLGEKTKTDCFGYTNKNGHESCYGLNELYCKNKECRFYRNDLKVADIERSVKMYSVNK